MAWLGICATTPLGKEAIFHHPPHIAEAEAITIDIRGRRLAAERGVAEDVFRGGDLQ